MAKLDLTPKDFAPHVLAVIGEMTKFTPGVVVPMEDTFAPICARMQINSEDFGTAMGKNLPLVYRKIQLAMRQLRDHGLTTYPSRGQWTLTDEGRTALLESSSSRPIPESLVVQDEFVAAPVASRLDAVATRGDSPSMPRTEPNVVRLARHPYSDDEYIRGLAIERTSCMGAFSSRSDVCKRCPLQRECLHAAGVLKAEIAVEIIREELEAQRIDEQKRAKKARQDASIDELIASQESPAKSKEKTDRYRPQNKEPVEAIAQSENMCPHCKETLPKGTSVYWVEEVGLFHPECIEVPLPP